MKIQLVKDVRGEKNSIHEVYMKILDRDDDAWYIIRSVEGYAVDNSTIMRADRIVYNHHRAIEENGFVVGEKIPYGFTFVPNHHCREVKIEIKSNEQAKHLLSKEF